MRLGEKIRYLREMEGTLRGVGREMTQQEIVRAIKKDLGESLSQSYLSQIESGARPHLTNSSRMLLAINALAKGFNGRPALHVYGGTVPAATVTKRRAANKAARKARRGSGR